MERIPFGVGFALYIPQFFGTQAIRVAPRLAGRRGCVWLAAVFMGEECYGIVTS
jgi:hypothetical protein